DTAENAEKSAALLKERGCRRGALGTDGWHLPRAGACFRKHGLGGAPGGRKLRGTRFAQPGGEPGPTGVGLRASPRGRQGGGGRQRAGQEWRSLLRDRMRGKT